MVTKVTRFRGLPVTLAVGLLAAASVPLAFHPEAFHAFELPKALLLRALALAALAGATLEAARSSRARVGPHPLVGAALLFGGANVAAVLASDAALVSLWGAYERQYGLLTIGSQLMLFLSVVWGVRRREHALALWDALIWGSAPVVAYALLQALAADPFAWHTDGTSPVMSTLGRSNFLGSYLVMIVPLTVARLLIAGRRWPHGVLLGAQLAAVLLTQARAAWIGLGAAGSVLLFLLVEARPRRRLVVAAGMAILGAVAILVLAQGRLPTPLHDLPGAQRFYSLFDLTSGSTAARVTIWRTALALTLQRPLLGYGPDLLRPVFAQQFPPELVYYQGRGFEVDRAHNLWLDLALSGGFATLISYLVVLVSFGLLVRRRLREGEDAALRHLWIGLAALVVGHLVELQGSFETVATGTVLWLAMGLAVGLDQTWSGGHPISPPAAEKPGGRLIPALSLGVVIAALVLSLSVRPLLADVAYRTSLRPDVSLYKRMASAERAVRRWPIEPVYRVGLAEILVAQGRFDDAEAQLEVALLLQPADPQLWVALGQLYAGWGALVPVYLGQAEAAYQKALALSPNTAEIHVALGSVYAAMGQSGRAISETERAIELDATNVPAYRQLSSLYDGVGRTEEADWAVTQARSWSARVSD